MTLKQLAAQLGVSTKTIRSWVDRGLPHGRRGRAYDFDPQRVAEWLVEAGLAKTRRVVRTRGEVARFFEVSERTIGYWQSRGMPGGPGDYDLDEIVSWREREGLGRSDEDSVRALGQRIDNEMKQLKLGQLRGELIAVEPIVRLFTRHIHEAKAIFEQIPERVLSALPAQTPAKTRRRIRQQCRKIIDDSLRSLSDLLAAPELTAEEAP